MPLERKDGSSCAEQITSYLPPHKPPLMNQCSLSAQGLLDGVTLGCKKMRQLQPPANAQVVPVLHQWNRKTMRTRNHYAPLTKEKAAKSFQKEKRAHKLLPNLLTEKRTKARKRSQDHQGNGVKRRTGLNRSDLDLEANESRIRLPRIPIHNPNPPHPLVLHPQMRKNKSETPLNLKVPIHGTNLSLKRKQKAKLT